MTLLNDGHEPAGWMRVMDTFITLYFAVLGTLVGLGAVVIALIFLGRDRKNWQARLISRQGVGALSVLLAGCLLIVGGQYKLIPVYQAPAKRAAALTRLQLLEQEPLYALRLDFDGPDPFRDQPAPPSLQVRLTTRGGQPCSSRIAPEQLKPVPPENPAEGVQAYTLTWPTLVENVPTDPERAVAARFAHIGDFRQLESVELDLVPGDAPPGQAPTRLAVKPNGHALLLFSSGPPNREETGGGTAVITYRDTQPVGARMTGWESQLYAEEDFGSPPLDCAAVAFLLLVAGAALLISAPDPDALTATLAERLKRHTPELRPLWLSGLAVLLIICVRTLLNGEGPRSNRIQHASLGLLFLVLAAASPFFRRLPWWARVQPLLGSVLAAFFCVAVILSLAPYVSWQVALVSVIQWACLLRYSGLGARPEREKDAHLLSATAANADRTTNAARHPAWPRLAGIGSGRSLVSLFISVALWTALFQLLTQAYANPFFRAYLGWFSTTELGDRLLASKRFLLVFALSFSLVLVNVLSRRGAAATNAPWRPRLIRNAGNAVAVIVFGLASFHTDHLVENENAYWHWGFLVNPAEDVRQGGWLLWTVPSNYGFLSMLTLAVLPFKSVFQSLYVVNSSLVFLSALFLFLVFRSGRTGLANWLFSLALTLTAVFWIPGSPRNSDAFDSDALMTPSVGAFRFVWCYALLALLLWDWRRQKGGRSDAAVRLVGCLTWVVGTLWAFDSAVYCAAIWLPAYTLMVLRGTVDFDGKGFLSREGIRHAALWMALPALLLVTALGCVTAYYRAVLGHTPDWSAFTEVAAHFGAYSADWVGPWLWFSIFCVVSSAAWYCLRKGSVQAAPVAWGAWAVFLVTSSVYVTKTELPVLLGLSPLICVASALLLCILDQDGLSGKPLPSASLYRASFIPILSVLLTAGMWNARLVLGEIREVKVGYQEIERQLPALAEPACRLLEQAGVTSDNRIEFLDDPLMARTGNPIKGCGATVALTARSWLPWGSWKCFLETFWRPDFAPEKRIGEYLARHTARSQLGGYLLLRRGEMEDPSRAWLFDQLRLTHRPTIVCANAEYELVKWDRK